LKEKKGISVGREKKKGKPRKKKPRKREASRPLFYPPFGKKETGQRRKTGIYALKPHLGRDPAEIIHQKKKNEGERAGK